MRLIALPLALALCIAVFACKGREQAPPDTAATVPLPQPANSAATPESTAGAVSTPAETSATPSDTAVPKATQKVTHPPDTAKASQKTGTQKTDTTQRKFKKPEIRPNYPPIDRRRNDTTTRRDTSGDR